MEPIRSQQGGAQGSGSHPKALQNGGSDIATRGRSATSSARVSISRHSNSLVSNNQKLQVTYRTFNAGYENTPSLIFTVGPGPFRETLLKNGQIVFSSKISLTNTRNFLVSYLLRCVDEQKLIFLPAPIGLLGPEEEATIYIISNPTCGGVTLADGESEFVEILGTAVNVSKAESWPEQEFWDNLTKLWSEQRLGFTFPRMEVQLFRPANPPERDANIAYLSKCIGNYVRKSDRHEEAANNLRSLRKSVTNYTLAGMIVMSVLAIKSFV